MSLINTIISATIGVVSVLITQYLQKNIKEEEKKQKDYDTYKKYAKPIILAAESLAWRLKEVLLFNGAYLLPDAPKNGFFKYKFDSTVYRLCALIGWIRAAQKEFSYVEGVGDNKNKGLIRAINSFQKALADGDHVEVSIYEELCTLYGLELKDLPDQRKKEIGVEIEKIVFKLIPDQVKRNVKALKDEDKLTMVSSILNLISSSTNQKVLTREEVKSNLDVAITEISREFCWIYRDWQSAIGDEMLISLNNSYRFFDILGFSDFVIKHDNNVWLKKIDNLFSNLDVSVDDRFDSRVSQVKQIYSELIIIIEAFNKVILEEEAISKDGLKSLKKFRDTLFTD